MNAGLLLSPSAHCSFSHTPLPVLEQRGVAVPPIRASMAYFLLASELLFPHYMSAVAAEPPNPVCPLPLDDPLAPLGVLILALAKSPLTDY